MSAGMESSRPASEIGLYVPPDSLGAVVSKLQYLWGRRELLYFFVWRDLKVRYKQTALGFLWVIVQPVLTMAIFTLFFSNLAKMPSDNIPYALFAYIGLVPWFFFANGIRQSSVSIVGNAALFKKVYFPRIFVPLSSVVAGFLDFVFACVILIGLLLYYGIGLKVELLLVFPIVGLLLVVTLGVGLWLASLNVLYRDVNYLLPFLTQLLFFATPVTFPSSLLQGKMQILYALNPLVGIVEGFRWALVGTDAPLKQMLALSSATGFLLFLSGTWYFLKNEGRFSERI